MKSKLIFSLLAFLILIITWKFGIFFQYIDPSFYPDPLQIIKNTFDLFFRNEFQMHVFHSLKRLSIALGIATSLAYLFAFLSIKISIFEKLFSPMVAFIYPLPKVALFPLLLIIFGIDDKSKIAMIALGTFFILYINFKNGFEKIVNSDFMNVALIYDIKGFNFYYQILFKGSYREQIMGIIGAINYGLTLMVVSEYNLAKNGIGYFIWSSWDQFRILDLYSALLVLGIIGVIIYQLLSLSLSRQSKKLEY